MTNQQQRENARRFINEWSNKGSERRESQQFWSQLLGNVLGMENLNEIQYEKPVYKDGTSGAIDVYIPETNVLIEQKSRNISLDKKERKTDGSFLTPYEQARTYEWHLPRSEKPRFIVTCNFKEFWIYDQETPYAEPVKIQLEDLQDQVHRLSFLLNKKDVIIKKELEVSVKAGEIVGILYDELYKQYINPTDPHNLHSLNVLCVRLVFCLYAEDAGIFGHKRMFHDHMERFEARDFRDALLKLFTILDTKPSERSLYLDKSLAAFPFVNGSLFDKNENIEVPQFTEKIVDIILNQASKDFDWSHISPTIFGAVFESTLNPETRRTSGMHYTSVENIHKVINPLFLSDLKKELEEIKSLSIVRTKKNQLEKFQDKLASLNFLDPACGSGNFLTESYICIRRLENEVIKEKQAGQMVLGEAINPVKVSIEQFYGIEINDFAVTVAKTALWIAESQMLKETEDIILQQLDFLPLESNACIIEGNALSMDWNHVISKHELNYIMGNPPFVGFYLQSRAQKEEIHELLKEEEKSIQNKAGKIDYVAGWYFKAIRYIAGTSINVAFVSTNSICQGEQVSIIWKPLIEKYNADIIFAYRTFIWTSQANEKASVFCVIIGFNTRKYNPPPKIIFDDKKEIVNNITPYLTSGKINFVEQTNKQIHNYPNMYLGSLILDNQKYIISENEKKEILSREPALEETIHRLIGSRELLQNKVRYVFYLDGLNLNLINNSRELKRRIAEVSQFRKKVSKEDIKLSDTPTKYKRDRYYKSDILVIPRTSSSDRDYLPIGFFDEKTIATDATYQIIDATLDLFAILSSKLHILWLSLLGGRLKQDFRYSNTMVYNTFPIPLFSEKQVSTLRESASKIINIREKYLKDGVSLATLYNRKLMPPELRKAHEANDKIIFKAYGFGINEMSDGDYIDKLMEMYQELTIKK